MRHFHVGDYFRKNESVTITRNFTENIGDVNMSITDLKVPRQFIASSADQYVSFRMPKTRNFPNGSSEAQLEKPVLTGTWNASGSQISFSDRAKWVYGSFTTGEGTSEDPYVTTSFYRLTENTQTEASHVDWRVAKYSSQEEAVSKVNEALIASKINGRVYSDEENRPVMVNLSRGDFTDLHMGRPVATNPPDLAVFAFELYVINNALGPREQQIILEFRSLSDDLDNNFMKVDCGTFTFQPGVTRLCPYDVFTGSDRAKPDEGPQRSTSENDDGSNYHNVSEVKRPGFERMAVDLVGSLGCRLSHMRRVRLSPDVSSAGSAGSGNNVDSNINVGIASYAYCATIAETLFYDSVAPMLVPHEMSMGIIKDARDSDQYLYLSPVLSNRLHLAPAMRFQNMERRMGDTVEEIGVVVSKNRDMVQAYGITPCLSQPSFNDVIAIAPCQLGEPDSFDARQNVSEKGTASFQFPATETMGHYESSSQVRPISKKMKLSNNQVEFQMQALVANTITKKTEQVAVKHGRDGNEYAGVSFTAAPL